jgi:SagB-type dehydrogenase family enzyme
MSHDAGDRFQQETKYHRHTMPAGRLDPTKQPEARKTYASAKKIALPDPLPLEVFFQETVQRRKSVRDFSDRPVTIEELSYLLWASTGISRVEHGYEFRTSPSAGALYPIETYVVANNVGSLPNGLYHYAVKEHALEELKSGYLGEETARAALEQDFCREAAAVFIWTAVFDRSKWKYGERAYRYAYLDAGHIAAHLSLAAVGLNLGSCQVGALFDDEINRILGIDGREESVLYMSAVGHPA